MSSTSSSIFKTLSMADSCLLSLPSIFASKSPYPSLSIPTRPTKLHLSHAFSTPFSPSLSLKRKTQFLSTFVSAAQVEDENTITLDQDDETQTQVPESEADGEAEVGNEPEGGEGSFEDAGEGSDVAPSEDAKVFVANLPYSVDSERLAMLFEQAGVVEMAEVIYNRETDRSRGFGFVTMSTVEEAEKAVEKFNRYELDGRPLTVNKASPREERLERPPPAFATGFRIYIGNLPWDVDNSRLEQIFSEHGKVEDARVVYDRETGRSRGFGFVRMAEESAMNDAIAALDGQSIDGRTLRVSVAEQRPRS